MLVRSWEHLPFSLFSPLPFSPSLFLSFLLSLLPPSLGVPGCFCHSWEPSPLFLWCVLGRMRRSWEHLPFFFSPFSRSFFASWGFPECNTQDHPSLSLVCPWTLVRSWEHLSFFFSPLPFSPSLFLSFLLSLLPPSFCHSWEPSPLFLWCVLGRMRRSWEHLPFFSLLFLVSPYPSLLSAR